MASFRSAPRNVNEQLVEYAEHGYVIDIDTPSHSHEIRVSAAVVILATAMIALGTATVIMPIHDTHSAVRETMGSVIAALGLALLVASVHHLYGRAIATPAVMIKPGAMIPPEMVRSGNWVHRNGAWARVDQVGPDHTGRISALLSSGDVVYLESSVVIAGDAFRPAHDPVSDLRT